MWGRPLLLPLPLPAPHPLPTPLPVPGDCVPCGEEAEGVVAVQGAVHPG